MAVGDNVSLHHVEISLVKEQIAQIAVHNVLKKAVIQLTLEEYNCLKAALLSTDTIFNKTPAKHWDIFLPFRLHQLSHC